MLYSRNYCNIVNQLYSNKINLKYIHNKGFYAAEWLMIYVSSKAVLDRWVNQYQNNVELRKKSKKSNKINDPLIM